MENKVRNDNIFDRKIGKASDFKFDKQVADVFDNMVGRSVPSYNELQETIAGIALTFIRDNTTYYDLGCSTGTTLLLMTKLLNRRPVKLVGIDLSHEMLDKTKTKLAQYGFQDRCELRSEDITTEIDLSNASVITMLWTLQFVRPEQRFEVVRRIYRNLLPGGCFILAEKILGSDTHLSRLYINLYHNFKMRQGYSELEIAQKREALENVLVPYRVDENLTLLKGSGFPTVDVFFRWYNWAAFIAVK